MRGWTSDHVFADHFLHVGDDGHHKYMTITTTIIGFEPIDGEKSEEVGRTQGELDLGTWRH